jgi:hypothetical protein
MRKNWLFGWKKCKKYMEEGRNIKINRERNADWERTK